MTGVGLEGDGMNQGTFAPPCTALLASRRCGAWCLRRLVSRLASDFRDGTLASAFVVGLCVLANGGMSLADARAEARFPRGFRSWTHVKTSLIGPQSEFFEAAGGLHHVYANGKAITGLRSGSFPDGAVLVFELLGTVEHAGVIDEGARKRVDVMVKDNRSHKDSGGWGFARYLGDDETKDVLTSSDRASCFACHRKAAQRDHVFSRLQRE